MYKKRDSATRRIRVVLNFAVHEADSGKIVFVVHMEVAVED